MKFESHLKKCGIYATLYKDNAGRYWIREGRNGLVLARCPAAFIPVSAANVEKLPGWIEDILIGSVDNLELAELKAARIEKDGRAKDIIRVFGDKSGKRECAISQAAFSLIERHDGVRIFCVSEDLQIDDMETEELEELPEGVEPELAETIYDALVITDFKNTEIYGIILSVTEE